MRPQAFHELWRLAEELAPSGLSPGGALGKYPRHTFDCAAVGMLLRPEEGRDLYDVTPLNADTFAHTGGDGVHFSLLHIADGCSVEEAPVVMTVPMADRWNFIVGENFRDFLALGCQGGYFGLEQLAYDRSGTIARIQRGDRSDDKQELALLDAIVARFDLRPWPDVAGKLADLERRFADCIRLSDEAKQWLV